MKKHKKLYCRVLCLFLCFTIISNIYSARKANAEAATLVITLTNLAGTLTNAKVILSTAATVGLVGVGVLGAAYVTSKIIDYYKSKSKSTDFVDNGITNDDVQEFKKVRDSVKSGESVNVVSNVLPENESVVDFSRFPNYGYDGSYPLINLLPNTFDIKASDFCDGILYKYDFITSFGISNKCYNFHFYISSFDVTTSRFIYFDGISFSDNDLSKFPTISKTLSFRRLGNQVIVFDFHGNSYTFDYSPDLVFRPCAFRDKDAYSYESILDYSMKTIIATQNVISDDDYIVRPRDYNLGDKSICVDREKIDAIGIDNFIAKDKTDTAVMDLDKVKTYNPAIDAPVEDTGDMGIDLPNDYSDNPSESDATGDTTFHIPILSDIWNVLKAIFSWLKVIPQMLKKLWDLFKAIPGSLAKIIDILKELYRELTKEFDLTFTVDNFRNKFSDRFKYGKLEDSYNAIKNMDTSRGEPPKVIVDFDAIFRAATKRFGVNSSPFSSGEQTFLDTSELDKFNYKGVKVIEFFRNLIGVCFIINTFEYVWKKVHPKEAI